VKQEVLIVPLGVINSPDGEFKIDRVNVAFDRNAIPELETQPVSQLPADQAGRSLLDEGPLLVWGRAVFRVKTEESVGIDSESGKEVVHVPRAFVGASKPLEHHHLFDAGHLPDLLSVIKRERASERNTVSDHQPEGLVPSLRAQKKHVVETSQNP